MGVKLSLVGNYYSMGILELQAASAWAITLCLLLQISWSQVCTMLTNAGRMWVEINSEGARINTEDFNFKLDQIYWYGCP